MKYSLMRGAIMTVIGLFVLSIIVWSTIYLINSNGVRIYSRFINVDGLHSGAEVRLLGVKVGKILNTRFSDTIPTTQDTQFVEVEILLEKNINGQNIKSLIYKDAVAVLRSSGALAERIIDISPGKASSGNIQDNDHIRGEEEPNLQKLVQRGDILNRNFDQAKINFSEINKKIEQGDGTIGAVLYKKSFEKNLMDLNKEFLVLESAFTHRKTNVLRLRSSIDRIKLVIDTLRNNITTGKGNIGKFLYDEKLQKQISDLSTKFGKLIEKINLLETQYKSGTIGKFSKDRILVSNIGNIRNNLQSITMKLENSEGTIGKLLHDKRLNNTLTDLSLELLKTVHEVKKSPFRYIKLRFELF